MKPLQVGERVAGDWYDPETSRYVRVRGKFCGGEGEALLIEDRPGIKWRCAPYSIRRLKPKRKAREYVIHLAPGEMPRVCSYAEFMLSEKAALPHPKTNEFVHVREVIKPKEK